MTVVDPVEPPGAVVSLGLPELLRPDPHAAIRSANAAPKATARLGRTLIDRTLALRFAGRGSVMTSVLSYPAPKSPSWSLSAAQTAEGRGQNPPPTADDAVGQNVHQKDEPDAEDGRREQVLDGLVDVPEQDGVRERLTDPTAAEHHDHRTDYRTDHRCGTAHDHGDEKFNRQLEDRRRRRGREALDEHEARTGDTRVQRTGGEREHLDPGDVDPDRLGRGFVIAHRDECSAEPAAHHERDRDDSDDEGCECD